MSATTPTNVRAIFEELEKTPPLGVTADKIENDIKASNALFVLLSENVEELQHTRDWVTWECGRAVNKEVWVFEPAASHGKISIAVPKVNHYVIYEETEEWRVYIRSIIENYDDSKVLPTLLATATTGAAINDKDRVDGAIGGLAVGVLGLLLQAATKPSLGFEMRCYNCWSVYRLHKGNTGEFRCPVCNAKLVLP
jgi:hypothetical protein